MDQTDIIDCLKNYVASYAISETTETYTIRRAFVKYMDKYGVTYEELMPLFHSINKYISYHIREYKRQWQVNQPMPSGFVNPKQKTRSTMR